MYTTTVSEMRNRTNAPSSPDRVHHLDRCELFGEVPPEQMRRLEIVSRTRSVSRNSSIYLSGDEADEVFLLTSGRVKICHLTADGKQSILAFVEPGELFGELAIFDFGPREEYAEAVELSNIVRIPSNDIRALMRDQPQFAACITRMIGSRRRRVEQRLKNLLFLSNRDRLSHLLLELAEEYGTPTDEGTATFLSKAFKCVETAPRSSSMSRIDAVPRKANT
jgi:CRP/FNR family cyclic AMP-dependent transcriptional regulator